MVVPAQFFFAEQTPNKSQAQTGPRQNCAKKPYRCLAPGNVAAVDITQLDFPGFQAQSLSAMGPEPAIKQIADSKQIKREDILIGRKGLTGIER